MRRVTIMAVVLLAGATAFSYGPLRSYLQGEKVDNLPTLRVVRSTLVESTVAIGTIKSKVGAEVKVGSQLSGVVRELRVSVGDRVAKGDLLASLHDADWRARLNVLRAQLASATAEKDFAETELARIERLGEIVPSLEIENARRNLIVKRAEVRRVQASVAQAEITLGYTVIKAPVSGTIASVSTYEGETIAASLSAPTFLTIVDLNRLEVQSYVDENDIGKVQAGQRVTFRVDAFPGRELTGLVQAIYPKAQLVNNVVNYVVIISIADAFGLPLRPEMTVHVNFILEEKEQVISIPRAALLRERGLDKVIVREGEQWIEKPVKTGLQTPQSIEIVSGLREGETFLADKKAWKENLEKKND